jgi:hypothetical protein
MIIECPVCLGNGNDQWAFGYCDEHDVCVDCGINRKDLKGRAAWGTRYGAFQCNDCEVTDRKNRIKERQEKGFDHEYTDKIVCPHCGNEFCDSWEMSDSGEVECDECKKTLTYERIVTVQYITEQSHEAE